MSTIPARATTVWQLAGATGQPLEVVIFQAVAYGAWQEGGVISAEWSDALSSVLHGSAPWRRQKATSLTEAPGGPQPVSAAESTAAFAARVLATIGAGVPIGQRADAEAAERGGLGELHGDTFTGFADEAATWSQLAAGAATLDDLEGRA